MRRVWSSCGLGTLALGAILAHAGAAGAQAEAMDNLSRLDVSRAGQLTMRPEAASGPVVNVDAKNEEQSILDSLPDAPKTTEEGLGLILWALMLLIAAGAYALYRNAQGGSKTKGTKRRG